MGAKTLASDLQEARAISWRWAQRQLGELKSEEQSPVLDYLSDQMEKQVAQETLSAAESVMASASRGRDREASAVAYALDERNLQIMGKFLDSELEAVIVSTAQSYSDSKDRKDSVGAQAHFDNLQGICSIALAMEKDFLERDEVSEGCGATAYEKESFEKLAKKPWHLRACIASSNQKSRNLKDLVRRAR